jgi:hypothetical protein
MELARGLGLRTLQRKRIGGHPLTISGVHRLLTNPFYAGLLIWTGQSHEGAHEPLVTLDELDRVKNLLTKPGKPTPQRRTFPFTGLIRCAECGFMVTAEDKTNRYGKSYTYYHCTKRRLDYRCGQPSISSMHLDAAMRAFLGELGVPKSLHDWGVQQVTKARAGVQEEHAQHKKSLQRVQEETRKALSNLTTLRIREMISDEDFSSQRESLLRDQLRLRNDLALADQGNQWFEPAHILLSFSRRAMDWFEYGGDTIKRRIIMATGSNLLLKDKVLSIEATKPFCWLSTGATRSTLRAGLNAVSTLYEQRDPEFLKTLELVKQITREMEALPVPLAA